MPKPSADFSKNVFINCPFDDQYTPIFRAIVFAVTDLGFHARCALEVSNAAQIRLDKIQNIIAECRYAIHDISRTELDKANQLPRFNMPLELGLDLGCKRYGDKHQKQKSCLILDSEKFRYQKFISDIAGQDISAHHNDPQEVIKKVRNFLQVPLREMNQPTFGAATLQRRYGRFEENLPVMIKEMNLDLDDLSFLDFLTLIAYWIESDMEV